MRASAPGPAGGGHHTDATGGLRAPSPDPPLTSTGKLSLWRLENRDIGPLQSIITDPSVGSYWRNRGSFWAPYQVQAMLGREVLVSAIATLGPQRDDPLVGLVEALDPSLVDGRAQLTAIVAPAFLSTGLGIEMVLLFVRWVFDSYPLEKFQLEVQAGNRRLIPGLKRLLSHEGTFRRHLHILGEWHDVEVFALWKGDLPRLMAVLQGLPPGRPDAG